MGVYSSKRKLLESSATPTTLIPLHTHAPVQILPPLHTLHTLGKRTGRANGWLCTIVEAQRLAAFAKATFPYQRPAEPASAGPKQASRIRVEASPVACPIMSDDIGRIEGTVRNHTIKGYAAPGLDHTSASRPRIGNAVREPSRVEY
ncbi:MAG: hypothetical protein Q9184_002596 [Pyrenodesmia sp. 2 TL-2023]